MRAKCPGCGLVQFVEGGGCRRCGQSLDGVATVASLPPTQGGSSLPPLAQGVAIDPYAPPATSTAPRAPARIGARLASRGSRLVAALLDSVVVLVPIVPAAVASALVDGPFEAVVLSVALVGMLGIVVYQIVGAMRGQTIGKRLMAIRVDYQGQEPGFYRGIVLRVGVPFVVGLVPFIGSLFGLADVLCIFREDRRCIHDHIAGTTVLIASGI